MQSATEIPISEIDADALIRDRIVTDPAQQAQLQRSVAAIGLRQPIEVWALHSPRPPLLFGLISGQRRLAAFRALGQATIPAFLRSPASISQAMVEVVSENEVRARITPCENGRLILSMVNEGHLYLHAPLCTPASQPWSLKGNASGADAFNAEPLRSCPTPKEILEWTMQHISGFRTATLPKPT